LLVKKPKNLVIPMCGIGKRFSDAGFINHKSMIEVDGKSMLERVINKFDNINIYLITTKKIESQLSMNSKWEEVCKKINIIFIDDHKLGPAYSIYKAFDFIPTKIGTYISYCDITWEWSKESLLEDETEAAIFCHYGFHPHLVNNNFSAFCKPEKNNLRKLNKIKEKESFTNDWMSEPLSIGLFYINDFKKLKIPLNNMIAKNEKVANEFFPSILFNYIKEQGIDVDLISVESFVHYGTVKQLKDIKSWANYFKKSNPIKIFDYISKKYSASIMISGSGSRMKSVSKVPKYLLKAGKFTLIEHVINNLPINKNKLSIICNSKQDFKDISKEIEYFQISKTKSQFESLLASESFLREKNNFLLCSCDCFGLFNLKEFDSLVNSNSADIIIFGFEPSLIQEQLKSSYSSFTFYKNTVKDIYVKEIPNQNFLGLAGFFWFRNGIILSNALKDYANEINTLNREIIIDDIIKLLNNKKTKILFMQVDKYIHLGTPEEFSEYIYWNSRISSLI
tara:strand:+ start:555 stop:2078 length:1524 start_codon:yes stop_codon:yes gene_type:complete